MRFFRKNRPLWRTNLGNFTPERVLVLRLLMSKISDLNRSSTLRANYTKVFQLFIPSALYNNVMWTFMVLEFLRYKNNFAYTSKYSTGTRSRSQNYPLRSNCWQWVQIATSSTYLTSMRNNVVHILTTSNPSPLSVVILILIFWWGLAAWGRVQYITLFPP